MNSTPTSLSFQGLFERSAGELACRTLVVAAAIGPDEFAGMALAYLGNGQSVLEPFHVAFNQKQTRLLSLGDQNALNGSAYHFEHWPQNIRLAVAQARAYLREHCRESAEGVWIAAAPARLIQHPLRNCDVLLTSSALLDERVWMSISAHVGAPAGLEI